MFEKHYSFLLYLTARTAVAVIEYLRKYETMSLYRQKMCQNANYCAQWFLLLHFTFIDGHAPRKHNRFKTGARDNVGFQCRQSGRGTQ